jgi:tetratricopeptide (TPR) repeat protein
MPSILDKLRKRKTVKAPVASQFDSIYIAATRSAATRDFQRAIELYDQAIALNPVHAEVFYKRGNALRSLGRLDAALASYNRSIELDPDHAHAFCNRGVVQQSLGLTAQALSSYDQAIALLADDALSHYNRALLMQECFRWDEALAGYNRAIAIDPGYADAHYNRSLALLSRGDFEKGWRGYEWRWKNAQRLSIGKPRNFAQPLWLGEESIAGKRLFLHSEAGLGDTLQFCRYASLAAKMGATVILEVQRPLVGLLADLEGVSQLIAEGSSLPAFDYHCPLMSLPLAFRTTIDSVPAAARYLHSDDAMVARWRKVLGPRTGRRVGLAWSGNANNTIDRRRSIPLADLARHLPSEFRYFRLQKDVRAVDRAALDSSPLIASFDDDSLDFVSTAALCACMDIVISVDTSVAHLSGALGQKTWVLLPFSPDWRWMRDRINTPWYPSMRLYRQQVSGDWDEVLARAALDLRREFS